MNEYIASLIGVIVQIGICYALSTNRKKIDWKLVGWGIGLQVVFAVLILKTVPGQQLFAVLNDAVVKMLSFTEAGASFVFGNLVKFTVPVSAGNPAHAPELANQLSGMQLNAATGSFFAFNVLPTIVFFSALMALLYHVGIMQRLVYYVAWVMQRTMKTSGAESLSAAANIFVGQTEAPLVIKPYVDKMTNSELHCIMTGGMATIAGGVMAGYVGMLKDAIPGIAGHLIAASVMSAPAALVFAKILVPETEVPETSGKLELKIESIDQNVIDAAARGCSEGMALAINVAAMLIGFIALIAMGNHFWSIIAGWLGMTSYNTLEALLGLIATPFAWMLGVPTQDLAIAGELLGKKTILNEFVAYADLANYLNGKTLINGQIAEMTMRTRVILSYALCGFSNLGSIGIQIGGIGGIAPSRRGDLAKLGLRALLAGTFASFLTGNIAGMLI
ncbi:MAG TPA: nucleoside transporter C-terminal domain-containing protein [Candidatus Rifleibacterium sp.]|nr:nucleoside transporter C-terminal domain-containing protein [Candidatus Rifleibacterium sp.]HPT45687.1 nucleoside transporter C-terminal domain-containing protein [Candidatus Rifleibacterium sp.]